MSPLVKLGKRRTRALIEANGGFEAAANFCRIGKSKLHENASEDRPDSFMAIDVVADLEPLASGLDEPPVTGWLCMINGGVFVRLPSEAPSDGDALRAFARLAQEYGDASAAILSGAADGRIDRKEAAAAEAELNALIAQAVHVREIMRAIGRDGR